MKRNTPFYLGVVWLALALFANCKDSGLLDLSNPETLAGFYKLKSLTDKNGEEYGQVGLKIVAGKATTVQYDGVTATITLTVILNLTTSKYTYDETLKITIAGQRDRQETYIDTGTYSVNGTTLVIRSDDPEEGTITATLSTNGRDLTIENDDLQMVFEKQ